MKAVASEATRVQVSVYRTKIELIQKVVAEFYGLTLHETQMHKRKGSSIKARRSIHFLCRELVPKCPLTIVGLITGNGKAWDHSSVHHSCKKLNQEMNFTNKSGQLIYPEIRQEIDILREKIHEAIELSREQTVKLCPTCGQPIL